MNRPSRCRSSAMLLPLALVMVMVLLPRPLSAQASKKSVTTLLSAKWASTPFVLEMAEALAEEAGSDAFWNFIDFLSEEESWLESAADRAVYERGVEFCSRYLSWTQLQLLKLSLSLRSYSPRLETFQQIAADVQVPEKACEHVIHYGTQLGCSLADVDLLKSAAKADVFKIDHVFPHADEESPVVVLYARPGIKGFSKLHSELKTLASQGKITYVLRPYLRNRPEQKTRLSGYGVELQIKKTEYKAQDDKKITSDGSESTTGDDDDEGSHADEVEGFVFDKLREEYPDKKEKLDEFRSHLVEQQNELAPLKVWQLQDLSLQAAQRIMKAEEAEDQLKLLSDLAENFPSHAKKLSKLKVRKELKKEVKKNSDTFLMNMNVQSSDAALFINGMHFDMDYVDIFTIMDSLKSDGKVLDGLGHLGLTDVQAAKMMSLDFSSNKQTYGIDIRDSAIHWINDIENDKMYKTWSSDLTELLRPTFPGMLRSIKRNLFNIVIMCDPSTKEARPLLRLLESFYIHKAPTRIGIVFTVNDDPSTSGESDAGVALLNAFNYISQEKEPYDALSFMTDVFSQLADSEELTPQKVKKAFKASYGKTLGGTTLDEVFEEDSEYDVGRQLAKDFVQRSGFKSLPQVLMNGIPLDQKNLNGEDFEEGVMMSLMKVTNELQHAVYRKQLKESDDVIDYLMKQPNIMPRLNDRILKTDKAKYIDLSGDPETSVEAFESLPKHVMAATIAGEMKYLLQKEDPKKKLKIVTLWVIADLETKKGREVLSAAMNHLKGSSLMRIGLIHNTKKPGLVSRVVQAAFNTLDNSAAKHLIAKVLKEDTVKRLESGKKTLMDYDIPGADMAALNQAADALKNSVVFSRQASFAQLVIEAPSSEVAIVVNGKVIGPLETDEEFGSDDFNLLEKFTMAQYGDKMITNFYSFMDMKSPVVSDIAMKTIALLLTRPESKSRSNINAYADKHSVIRIPPQFPDRPAFDIVAIIDPVSRGAQKIAPVLLTLKDVLNAKVSIYLNCVDKHSEMPQKSYYRTVLSKELQFNANGMLSQSSSAKFSHLPEETILTMHHHIPDNWLIEPVKSVYDLDNIKLSNVEGNVHSEFELEYLLLEGHCFEAFTGNPPRGLQLTLGTEQKPVVVDTIVMANLGYLQLKSSPGRWIMNLREGRSLELYDIVSHEGTESANDEGKDIQVLIDSFKTKVVKLRVQKKADKRNEELLEGDSEEENDSLWGSLTKTFTGSGNQKAEDGEDEPLNIFCLASGHLYERLLKIMMFTTLKHTKAPVKFWILKNYLSPSLKEFLPHYAAEYGFEYEYVQYKWPRWLNQQKEKQRIIWGYKILFLDVMFPLDVKKIIFVDTDQIVRADLTELRDMDLKGAPYGYTPFCDSNKDMEGFRFWKTGYWKNHLAGRPYHISALYVVDLVKFRRIAAGDRLRGQYQALSQDPNSLANLDQDLPNNMLHQVPIFSLPQDWLWCETWCDQEGKKTAKNIDLCNNPLTKESKLDAARRIVSEWTDIDDQITQFWEHKKEELSKEPASSSKAHSEHKHTEL